MGERVPKVYHVATTLNWFRDAQSESFSEITVIPTAHVSGEKPNFEQLLAISFCFQGHPITFTKRARGGYGRVFNATVPDIPGNPQFVVKLQKSTPKAVDGMKAAQNLKDCEVAKFKVFEVMYKVTNSALEIRDKNYLVTFMEKLDADCSQLVLENDADKQQFEDFSRRLLRCISDNKMTFTDMKPENIGYRRTHGNLQFRLLDLDGTDQFVFTYPMSARWWDKRFPTNTAGETAKQQQTSYAVAVTKLLVYTQSREFDQTIREKIHNVLKYKSFEKFLTRTIPNTAYDPSAKHKTTPEYVEVPVGENPEFLTPEERIKRLRFIGYSIFDEYAKRVKGMVITLLGTAESLRRRANLHDYI
mgnify:CR=1 FL=1|tara:strand:- start:743 stop:1822 length:1080 start_codon:yes stop_codon:yes gene_type:complete